MAKQFVHTYWVATQYSVVVEADTRDEAWENIAKCKFAGDVTPVFSHDPYDEELEEI